MRVVFRVILLLAAAGAAGFYGWQVRLAFRTPEPAQPMPEAKVEEAWQWGLELMEEHGYTPVGTPTVRQMRSGPAARDTYWPTGEFPWVRPSWRTERESVDLDPVELAPGECVGMLTRGGGAFPAPSIGLWDHGRWWAGTQAFGLVRVLQLCVPLGAEAQAFGAELEVSPMANGDFVNEGEVRWARFEGRMAEGDEPWLIGSLGSELKELFSDYAREQPGLAARAEGMTARRVAPVAPNDVLLEPHGWATYEKLLARFETAYPGKVPNPSLVDPSSGEVPASSADPEAIATQVQERTVFADGSRVAGHASLIDGRVLAAVDLDALGGCTRVVLHRHTEHAIPSLEVRIDEEPPVELDVRRRNVVVHDLCPQGGFARFVTHALDQATYTVSIYTRERTAEVPAEPTDPTLE